MLLVRAIFAGITIGIAGTVYLSVPNPIIGAVLFGFGLLSIVVYELALFTGRVGYFANNFNLAYLTTLVIVWIGNFIGTGIVGLSLRYTRVGESLVNKVTPLCLTKSGDNWLSLLILGFFCGILMYLAVEGYNNSKMSTHPFAKVVLLFACVVVFILCGFEHCVANMFYFALYRTFTWDIVLATLLVTLGNSLGGMLLPLGNKFRKA